VPDLIAPEDDDEILEYDEDALRLKPVMTGDLFTGVAAAGEDTPMDVMVAGHPCTIRRGAHLKSRVPCIRVLEHEWVPYRAWPRQSKNCFPISEAVGIGRGRCGTLDDWVTIDAAELTRERRRLTLQHRGILIFQQRLIHSLSRFVTPIDALLAASRHVLAEAELEFDWLFELDGTAPYDSLVADFAALMDADGRRGALQTDERRVRAEVRAELRHRRDQ
jgi:hypothetical protein